MKRFVALMAMWLLAGTGIVRADWTTWKYNAGDLDGSNSLEEAVDNLDDRMNAAGIVSSTAGGSSVTVTAIRVSGTATNTILRVGDSVTIGTNATVAGTLTTGTSTSTTDRVGASLTVGTNITAGATIAGVTVTGSGLVSSYGYPIVVGHTNGSAQVYLVQSGSTSMGPDYTTTNTFPVAYIATPSVIATYTASTTNAAGLYVTISTNSFIATGGTNYSWISYGRIK
jgi:hypothetical protein